MSLDQGYVVGLLESINSPLEVTDHGCKVRPLSLVCFSPVGFRYLHTGYRYRVGEVTGLLFSQGTTVTQEKTRTLEVYEIQCWTVKFKLHKEGNGDLMGPRARKR